MSWSEIARAAAKALSMGEEREDNSITVQLLRDIHGIHCANGSEGRWQTADLLAHLHAIEESPWGDWYGKPLSAHGLSRLLRPYRIKTMPVWSDGKTVKGYKVEQFADAFARVLGVRRVRQVRSGSSSQAAPNSPNPPNPQGAEHGDERLLDDAMRDPTFLETLVRDGIIEEPA
jgi:Protein of unknown function (DUF3631)